MFKLVLIAAFGIMFQNAYSQENTKLLYCDGSSFPFTVQFSGKTATATFKGFAHTAPYSYTFIGKSGSTYMIYKSQIIDITFAPSSKYVALYQPDGITLLSDANCK